jgi:hypothetical protein
MEPKMEDIYRLTLDTNRMVHKMRRGLIWGRLFQVVWWIAILAISGYTYYVYAQPYVDKLIKSYAQVQQTIGQAQNISSQSSGYFGNLMQYVQQYGHMPTSTPTTTPH